MSPRSRSSRCSLLPQAATDEDVLRGLVQQYYDAQTAKDADKALGFWSMDANPRMSREGFVAVFGAGDAQYTVEIQSVKISGNEARLRVAVTIARTIVRNDVPTIVPPDAAERRSCGARRGRRGSCFAKGPFAEDFADQLLARRAGRSRAG